MLFKLDSPSYNAFTVSRLIRFYRCANEPGRTCSGGKCVNQTGVVDSTRVLETRDLDQAAFFLRDAAIPYSSELMPGSPAFSTRIAITEGPRITTSRVATAGMMRVKSCLPADSFALVFDLAGSGAGTHCTARQTIDVSSDLAFVQSPIIPVEVRTTPDYEVLFVRFSRDALVEELEKMLDREVHSQLLFAPAFSLRSAAGQRLRQLCLDYNEALSADSSGPQSLLALRELEGDIISLLLRAHSHNYTRLANRQAEAGSFQLDAAEQYMRANAHLPLSLGDVCQAAGVNARTLQHSFRRKRGCTPMEFLRNVRMEQVRRGLLQPLDETSVSSVASRWGFLHFGRFSGEYRQAFGELPSETLRRARKQQ